MVAGPSVSVVFGTSNDSERRNHFRARTGNEMNAYCPECETELDQTTGICPACRWDPLVARATVEEESEPEVSLSERYRGTSYSNGMIDQQLAMEEPGGFSRGRAFVILGLIAGVVFYGGVIGAMGIL